MCTGFRQAGERRCKTFHATDKHLVFSGLAVTIAVFVGHAAPPRIGDVVSSLPTARHRTAASGAGMFPTAVFVFVQFS